MTHECDGRDPDCLRCAGIARRNAELRAVMTQDDRLDDIKRAQMWQRIDDRLGEPATRRAWWPALAIAAAFAAAAILYARPRHDDAPQALVAPAETALSTRLGPYTHASLVGPARLELVGAPGEATAVRLRSGTLLAEFTGGPGRSLRVEAPGVVVEIVGTLFAVEVRGMASCVSVSHGKVQVSSERGVIAVAGGESWCSDAATPPQPIAPEVRDELARHEATIVADREPAQRPPAPTPPPATAVTPIAPTPPPAIVVTPIAPTPAPPPTVAVHRATPPPPPAPAPVEAPPPRAPAATAPPPRAPAAAPPPPRAPAAAPPPPPAPRPGLEPVTALAISREPAPAEPPPSSAPAPAPAPVQPAPPADANAIYAQAEAALARRDLAGADRALAHLLDAFPDAPLVDQALYERARIAYQRHAWADAQRQLDRLAQLKASPLAEPGAYLSCRIAVEANDESAAHCLADYRARYPRSPHDLDVLGLSIELVQRYGGCAEAASLIDELARRYPASALAHAWQARCKR